MNKVLSILSFSIVLLFFGCDKMDLESELADKENKEEERIEQYLADSNLNVTPTETGLYYIEGVPGYGITPEIGDFIIFEYTLRLLDGTLVSTTDSGFACENSIYDSTFLYGPDKRQLGSLIQGENEAFTYMKENGTATIIVPFKLGYLDYSVDKIPPYSTLLFDLKLLKVIKDPEAHEKQLLQSYLSEHDDFVKLTDGLYYKNISKGSGIEINFSSKIDFKYSIKLLDGRQINSSEATELISNINLIGLKQGLLTMKEGERSVFIIRSDYAYGEQDNLSVPPYSSLIIDVEVKSVK